jgi:hypothetical protein
LAWWPLFCFLYFFMYAVTTHQLHRAGLLAYVIPVYAYDIFYFIFLIFQSPPRWWWRSGILSLYVFFSSIPWRFWPIFSMTSMPLSISKLPAGRGPWHHWVWARCCSANSVALRACVLQRPAPFSAQEP